MREELNHKIIEKIAFKKKVDSDMNRPFGVMYKYNHYLMIVNFCMAVPFSPCKRIKYMPSLNCEVFI